MIVSQHERFEFTRKLLEVFANGVPLLAGLTVSVAGRIALLLTVISGGTGGAGGCADALSTTRTELEIPAVFLEYQPSVPVSYQAVLSVAWLRVVAGPVGFVKETESLKEVREGI